MENGKFYGVVPTNTAVRIEFTAGTTIPKDALIDAVPVTIAEFLKSRRLVGEKC